MRKKPGGNEEILQTNMQTNQEHYIRGVVLKGFCDSKMTRGIKGKNM